MRVVLMLICLLAGLVMGCDDEGVATRPPTYPGQAIRVIREFDGQHGPFPARGFFVIQHAEAWEALWAEHSAPVIDFTHYTVLVALMGQRPTSGYDIIINEVRLHEGNIAVYVTESVPESSIPVAQVMSYPYHMVVIPKTSAIVRVITSPGCPPFVVASQAFVGWDDAHAGPSNVQVIRDTAAWQGWWSAKGDAFIPTVDFAREMVVGVKLTSDEAAARTVVIAGVEVKEERLVVAYRIATSLRTLPAASYALVVIPAHAMPVVFEETRVVREKTPTPVVVPAADADSPDANE